MPPRKSDTASRKSDISAARFVLADEEDTPMAGSAPSQPAPPASGGFTAVNTAFHAQPQPAAIPQTMPLASAFAGPKPITSTKPTASTPSSSTVPATQFAPVNAAAGPSSAHTSTPQPTAGGPAGASTPTSPQGTGKDKDRNDKETIEDFALPKSIVTRLAKGVLPPNTQIQANAILAMTKSASVFISHLANAANEITTTSGKKTIAPADVLMALDDIEYAFMRPMLEAEFEKFSSTQTSKRSSYRKKVAAARKSVTGIGSGTGPIPPGPSGAQTDISMLSADGTGMQGDESTMDISMARSEPAPRSDSHLQGVRAGKQVADDRMDVDGANEQSDAETVPDENPEEEEEEEEAEEEEEDEEEDEEDEENDRLEHRGAPGRDEALDGDESE